LQVLDTSCLPVDHAEQKKVKQIKGVWKLAASSSTQRFEDHSHVMGMSQMNGAFSGDFHVKAQKIYKKNWVVRFASCFETRSTLSWCEESLQGWRTGYRNLIDRSG